MLPRTDSPGLGLGLPLIAQMTESLEVHDRAGGGTEIRMAFALAAAEHRPSAERPAPRPIVHLLWTAHAAGCIVHPAARRGKGSPPAAPSSRNRPARATDGKGRGGRSRGKH